MSWCFINHSVIPAHEATVSVQDMGILRGFGVYDGVTVINNRAFRLQDHIHRFRESAAGLGLLVPYTDEEIEQAIAQLSDKMNASRYNVRFILTGGKLVDSLSFDKAHPTFYILSEKHIPLKPEVYSDGASLITHEYTRQYPQFKTINYITAVLTDGKKKQAGAIEVLFTQRGRVLECSTSNIFIVKDNVLITTASDVLKGITRKVVSELMSSTYRVKRVVLRLKISCLQKRYSLHPVLKILCRWLQ